jgi:NADPH2:quinone reductase
MISGKTMIAIEISTWGGPEVLKPAVHRSFPLAQAADAHRALEAGDHIGKIVLTTNLFAATT